MSRLIVLNALALNFLVCRIAMPIKLNQLDGELLYLQQWRGLAMHDHILISTDGSDLAQKGVDHGLALAHALGSRVTFVMATDPFPLTDSGTSAGWVAGPEDIARFEESRNVSADAILAKAKAAADEIGVLANVVHVPNEHAATAILDTAKAAGCDLIVMASHGRRGISRLLLGSQTAEVVAHSSIPILVVR